MKHFEKEEILNLLENKENFKNAIIESKGFILYQSKLFNVDISKETLFDTINKYSIRFILENFNNKDYSQKEIEVITSFIKEDSVENYKSTKNINYTYENLIDDILNNSVPKNVDQLVQITVDNFLKDQKILVNLLDKEDDDYFHNDKFNIHCQILKNTFRNIKKKDFLKIELEILVKNPVFFNMAKHLMKDNEIKILFNKVIDLHYNLPEIKKGGYLKKLSNYINYDFDLDEKNLFITLIKNEYDKDYKEISNHRSFNKFFKKNEYIFNYDLKSIKYLSKKEISENVDEIRNAIINNDNKKYYRFESLYELNIDESSFKEIFSKEFIKKLIIKNNDFDFYYFDRDYKKKVELANCFQKQIYELVTEDDNFLNLISLKKIIKNLNGLIEYNSSFLDEEYKKSIFKIFNNFNIGLKSEKLFYNVSDELHSYDNREIILSILNEIKNKESINYLYFLNKIIEDKNINHFNKKIVQEEIKRVIPILNHDEVIEFYQELNIQLDKQLLNYSNTKSSYEDNFLNFNLNIVNNMSDIEFNNILLISKKFRDFVIKNDLEKRILIADKYNNIFLKILNDINDDSSPYFSFTKKVIEKNKEYVLNNFFENLITHPKRENLIKIDTEDLENKSLNKIILSLKNYKDLKIEYDDLYNVNIENLSKKEKKEIYFNQDEVRNRLSKFEEELKTEANNLSFNIIKKTLESLDIDQAILFENILPKSHKNILIEKVAKINFKETNELLDNKLFLKFLYELKKDSNRYNGENEFILLNKQFTDNENVELVEKMFKNFNNEKLFRKKYVKEILLRDVLCFIDIEPKYRISKKLVIKHDPENMFNSYDYLPRDKIFFHTNVNERFTIEEILEAVDNLNKKGKKIICVSNDNLSHDNLLSNNFEFTANDNNKENPYFNDYLQLLKKLEKDPINYLACIHNDIIANFINRNDFEYLDEAKADFYNKYINVNVVISAMNEIFKLAQERESKKEYYMKNDEIFKGISISNAINAVSNFLDFTYYSNGDLIYSTFEEEKSKKLLKTIIEKAPYMFFNINKIGMLGNIDKELEKNFNLYYTEDFVENFFLKNDKSNTFYDKLNFSYDKKEEYWQSKIADSFMNSFIDYCIKEKNIIDLQKLDFIIKEHEFNEKERAYNKIIYDFNTPLTNFANQQEYKLKIEKGLLLIDLINDTNQEKKTKNKKNKI